MMNDLKIDFKTSFLSNSGIFVKNSGVYAYQQLDRYAFWVIADGLELNQAEVSARLAVEQIKADFTRNPTMKRSVIRKYLINAERRLEKEDAGRGLKASLILAVTDYSNLIWAVCGNSRLYYFREQEFCFRSRDQSSIEALIEMDNLEVYGKQTQAEQHYLTNYLGIGSGFEPYISQKYRLCNGDVFLLCNPGFWQIIRYDEITVLLKSAGEPADLLKSLQQLIEGKESKVLSNYVVGAIFVNQVSDQPDYQGYAVKVGAVTLATVILVGSGLFAFQTLKGSRLHKQAEVEKIKLIAFQQLVTVHEKKGDDLVKAGNFSDAAVEYQKVLNVLTANADLTSPGTAAIQKKYQFAKLINEGDYYFRNQLYQVALDRYLRAKQTEVYEYFKVSLDQKISVAQAGLIVATSTPQAAPKSTGVAAAAYQPKPIVKQNRTKAVDVKKSISNSGNTSATEVQSYKQSAARFPEAQAYKQPAARLPEAQTYKQNSAALPESQAWRLEQSGDELAAREEYKEATRAYKRAISIYTKAGLTGKAQAVKEKLNATRRKMRRRFMGAR